MLLRNVQLTLRTLLVFQEAFPQTSSFEEVMREEFDGWADIYVEKQHTQTNFKVMYAT